MPIPVAKGDPILPRMTAQWFNSTLQNPQQRPPGNRTRVEEDYDHIKYKLDETGTTEVGWLEPVVITGTAIEPSGAAGHPAMARVIAKCKKPASGVAFENDNWGISLSPVYAGQTGDMVVSGVTWAKIERTDSGHRYVNIDVSSYTLKSRSSGPARILSFIAESGTVGYGLIRLGIGSPSSSKIYLCTSDIPARTGSGTPFTPGSLSCTRYELYDDGGTIKLRSTMLSDMIYNFDKKIVPSGTLFRAVEVDGYATVDAPIKDLRINGYNYDLLRSLDAPAGWETWATGGACP